MVQEAEQERIHEYYILNEQGEQVLVSYEEYLIWEEEQRIKREMILKQQEEEAYVEDVTAYFYLNEKGEKVQLTKEQYKELKRRQGMSVQRKTSFQNKATVVRKITSKKMTEEDETVVRGASTFKSQAEEAQTFSQSQTVVKQSSMQSESRMVK